MKEIEINVIFWDNKSIETLYHYTLQQAFNENFIEIIDNKLVPTDECTIIRLFTGLLDKNKTKIFDKDILDNGKLVYWSDEQACYFCGDTPLCMSNSHRAVIGNIYQNRNLIKL
jgi:hypothetical protein